MYVCTYVYMYLNMYTIFIYTRIECEDIDLLVGKKQHTVIVRSYIVCMYVCMLYVCMYVCMYVICMYVFIYLCYMYVCMYVICTVCVYAVCMYVRMLYVCMYVCMYVMYVCMYLLSPGHFTEKDAALLMRDLISGLQELHSHDILHLDIKPENLLFDTPDPATAKIMITDFGLSKMNSSPNPTHQLSSDSGSSSGSNFNWKNHRHGNNSSDSRGNSL